MPDDKKPRPDQSQQFSEEDRSKTYHGNLSANPPTQAPKPPPTTYYLPEQPKRPKEK